MDNHETFRNPLENCRKIGIMGGTFNPIHAGHLLMGRFAKEYADLDAVVFIPAGLPHMKKNIGLLSGRERLYMVEQSIKGEKDFYASSIEIDRNGQTYTYETIAELHEKYPFAQLYFILGADSLFSFDRWLYPEKILSHCNLIAAARNGSVTSELRDVSNMLMNKYGGEIFIMEFPTLDISSTMIRERVKNGKSIRYLTTDAVCDYIEAHNLYL